MKFKFSIKSVVAATTASLFSVIFASPAYALGFGTGNSGGGGGGVGTTPGLVLCINGAGYNEGALIFSAPFPGCIGNTSSANANHWSGGNKYIDCQIGTEVWRFYGTHSDPTEYVTTSVGFFQPPAANQQSLPQVSTYCDRVANTTPTNSSPWMVPGTPGISPNQNFLVETPNPEDASPQPAPGTDPYLNPTPIGSTNTFYTNNGWPASFVDNGYNSSSPETNWHSLTQSSYLLRAEGSVASCASLVPSVDPLYEAYYSTTPSISAEARQFVQAYFNAYSSPQFYGNTPSGLQEAAAAANVYINSAGQITGYKAPGQGIPCASTLNMGNVLIAGINPTSTPAPVFGFCAMPLNAWSVDFYQYGGTSANEWDLALLGGRSTGYNGTVQYPSQAQYNGNNGGNTQITQLWRSYINQQVASNPVSLPSYGIVGQPLPNLVNGVIPPPNPINAANTASNDAQCETLSNTINLTQAAPTIQINISSPTYLRVGGALNPEHFSATASCVANCSGTENLDYNMYLQNNNGYATSNYSYTTTTGTDSSPATLTAGFYNATANSQGVTPRITGSPGTYSEKVEICVQANALNECQVTIPETITNQPIPASNVTYTYNGSTVQPNIPVYTGTSSPFTHA
jgi:hypothetical protein